jgi:fucose permease
MMRTRTAAAASPGYAGLVATINGCMFVFGIVLLLMGSLLPTLHVSAARAGSLGAFPLAGILIATIVIGPILDKAGAKLALAVSLAMIVAALTAMPSLEGFEALAAAAFIYGLGAGVLNAATNTIIATLSGSGRGSALNLLGLFFSLGALITPLLMSFTRGRLSPAGVLYLLAFISAIVLVLVLRQRFPPPLQASTPLRSLLRVLKHPIVWLFAALLFFESCQENCMFVWAGKVVTDLLDVPVSRADIALFGLTAAMGVGRLAASRVLRKLGNRSAILIAAATVIVGAVVVLLSAASYAGLIAGFAVVGLGLSAIYPTVLGLAGDRFPDETGTVFGAIITVSLVGGTLGPVIGSWAIATHPLKLMFVPIVAAVAIGALTLIATRRPASAQGSGA